MRKMLICIFLVLTIFSFTASSFAYDPIYSKYDVNVLEEKLKKFVPEGWEENWCQIERFDHNSDKEYIIVVYQKRKSDYTVSRLYLNQVVVFQPVSDDFQEVWSSDIFEGHIDTINFVDADNNGNKNINFIIIKEENNKRIHYLRVYDWNGVNTKLTYPQDNLPVLSSPDLISIEGYITGYVRIAKTIILSREPYKKKVNYYTLKDDQLVYDSQYITPDPKPSLKTESVESELAKRYPLINDIIKKHSSGVLSAVCELYFDGLYLIEVKCKNKESSYIELMIVEKKEDNVKFWYKLAEEYNNLVYYDLESRDLNGDGYKELMLRDGFTLNAKILYYIVSLKPEGAELISPVYEFDGRYISAITKYKKHGPLGTADINSDGLPEIASDTEYEGKMATLYWIWSEKLGTYVEYKIEVWDE